MTLFSLLFVPVFCLFWWTIFSTKAGGQNTSGGYSGVFALLLGCAAAVLHYFFNPLITPGGFLYYRWLHGFVDIICLPVIIPLFFCLIMVLLRIIPSTVNYTIFTLLFLIPLIAIRSISMNSSLSFIPLVLVPVLWIVQAVGIPFFAGCIRRKPRWYVIIPSIIGIAALPLFSVTSWWAFFSHHNSLGLLLLAISLVPAITAAIINEKREKGDKLGMRNEEGEKNEELGMRGEELEMKWD